LQAFCGPFRNRRRRFSRSRLSGERREQRRDLVDSRRGFGVPLGRGALEEAQRLVEVLRQPCPLK
jgi:hypothetical protein